MASAFKDYDPTGIKVNAAFGKVCGTAELTKRGDFEINAKTQGQFKGLNYEIGSKLVDLEAGDVSIGASYNYVTTVSGFKLRSQTKADLEYKDIEDINWKKPIPTKFSVSEELKSDISSTTLTYKSGKTPKLDLCNKIGYKFGPADIGLKFPTINFLDIKNTKALTESAEISVSTSVKNIKAGVKATELGKDLQFYVEDNFGFLKGKTTLKAKFPEKTIESAFERELVVSQNLSLASRFSFKGTESVKREYGIVIENNKKNLRIRGMMDNESTKKLCIDHEVCPNVKLHMVGISQEEKGRGADGDADGEGRTFSVGISFDA